MQVKAAVTLGYQQPFVIKDVEVAPPGKDLSLIHILQLADVLIVFQQLPALVIITKLIRFKGKREADGAGIVFGIHRRHNQVIAAGGGAAPVSYTHLI